MSDSHFTPHPLGAGPLTRRRTAPDAAPAPEAAASSLPPAAAGKEVPEGDDLDFQNDEIHKRYEQIKQGETHLSELQRMGMAELVEEARKEKLEDPTGLKRQDLIFHILKQRVKLNGLMYGEGTLEILPDGFGFLRSPDYHYLSCPDDIYVSPSQIRRFGLRTGSTVSGQIRPPKENERYFALLRVEAVNFCDPNQISNKVWFDDLTPLHPRERIRMEADAKDHSTRIVDMLTPIGFGQRGLIVSPPRAGKTILLQRMAKSVLANYPDAYVIMLLIDERPEEVTDMERGVKGKNCEVISSTFDEPPTRHVQVSQMVLEKAKRMVEYGHDVVIFLDSITRLARAWNSECQPSGKLLTGGLDANALQEPKRFFGSARKVEEGGSLTILGTALVETGSRMDEVIFEEFKGTGNMEIVLDRRLVEKRIWPAIDINRSGTRKEEMLFDEEEYRRICLLRRALHEMTAPDAMERLLSLLQKATTNADFLRTIGPRN
jgi:transcription termination factor Rho